MTQWYQPRQLQSGPNAGKWHYTCSNTSGTTCYAVGACGEGCPGHDTADEATRHYLDGLAAGAIRERESDSAQKKCEECGAWTTHRALLWGDQFARESTICALHDIRAHLRLALYKKYDLKP